VGALITQRIDQLQLEAEPHENEERVRTNTAFHVGMFLLTATASTTDPPSYPPPTTSLPATLYEPDTPDATMTLLQAAPLPTGGGPLGINVLLADEASTRSTRQVAYYDSGAWSSAVSTTLCQQLDVTPELGNGGKHQVLSFSGFTAGERRSRHTAVIRIKVGQEDSMLMRFWVVEDSPVPMLIGRDNMSAPAAGDDGRALLIDPDVTAGCITYKASGNSYPAIKRSAKPTATLHTTTTIPPNSAGVIRVQTNEADAIIQLPRAWVSPTLFSTQECTVTRTDSKGIALLHLTNIDDEAATVEAHTPLTMIDSPMLLTDRTAEETDPETDHGVTPLTRMTSDEIKKNSPWGKDQARDEVTVKAYMSNKELRRHLRTQVESNKLLSGLQRKRLLTCLMANLDAFSDEDTPIGTIKGHPVSFQRLDSKPIFIPPRAMSPAVAAEAIRQADELVAAGTMGPTTSPNNFAICMVKKGPNSPPRMCVDLRAYNSRYVGEFFPIPHLKDCINKIAQNKIYSALDATASFHQVPLRDDDGPIPSTHQVAITLPDNRRLSYRRLPFGMKDSSFVFSRILNQVLLDFQTESSIYIDDVCLHSQDLDSQIALIARVLPKLIEAGVRLNPRKTIFCVDKVDVLGHTVTHRSVAIQDEKLAAIRDLLPPRDRKELQSLIGVLSWSRRFVEDYATVVEPLTRLLRKGQPSSWPECWGEEQERAFRTLQQYMLAHPTLATPDFSRPFEVWTDASDRGIGAVLVQTCADGTKCAVEFYSKQHSDAERKYATPEKEALAVLRALTRFRTYLLMANTFKIVVKSDHRGLTSLYKHADESTRLWRWAQKMNEYDYVVEWLAGKSADAATPDGLSRARTLCQHTATWIENHTTEAEQADTCTLLGSTRVLRARKTTTPTPPVTPTTTPPAAAVPPTPSPTPTPTATPTPTVDTSKATYPPTQDGSCQRQVHCRKPNKHSGRCQRAPVHAPDSQTVTRYDHIVCRAIKKGGVVGFRVRWRGFGPEGDSYETKRQMSIEVTHHNLDALIGDFVLRERRGEISIALPPGSKYPQWTNALSPLAPTPRDIVADRHQLPPFPSADAKSDRGFLTFDGIDQAGLLQHQQQEPDTADYLRYLTDSTFRPTRLPKGTHHSWAKYAASMHVDEETGLLMRRYVGTTGPYVGQQHHVIVLPETLLQRVFDWSHALAGHHGAHATMWTIRTRFHCWKLESRVRACIAACEICSRADRSERKQPYGSIPVSTFNSAIGFDLMGPFSAVGSTGQEYLVVMVDHATKYLVVHAVNGPGAEDAVEALQEYILQMGTIPERIFTDRGSFVGHKKVYAALLARLGINHHQALSYNPQGDSHAESSVKNISRILKKIIQDYPNRWPEAARWAAYCYNCKYNTTTGTSPFYALHAVEPTQPIDFLMPRPTTRPVPADITELADRIGQINLAVEEGVAKLHQSYQARNASLRGVREYQAGDLVWKHRLYPESFEVAGIDTKWFLPFEPEPYMVLARRSAQHSRIRLAYNTQAKPEGVHHQRLKHCSPREDALQFELAVPLDNADTNPNPD
jgi:hypothetical protein